MEQAPKNDKVATLDTRGDIPSENYHHTTPRKDLNVRTKKSKHSDRAANKGDGSLVLVSAHAILTGNCVWASLGA